MKTIRAQLTDRVADPYPERPRAIGEGLLRVKHTERGSAIRDLRMSGCLKLLFGRARDRVEAITLNTSGGLTSGDRITLDAQVEAGSALSLTTQAAERAYRAEHDMATMRTRLTVADGACVHWLPQELIVFDGARLDRALQCDLTGTARALLVEPVLFGRLAMGEVVRDLALSDRITVTRDGAPLMQDAIRLDGAAQAHLDRTAIAGGLRAMVTLIYVATDAEARLAWLQPRLPDTAGASMPARDVMVMRALAPDSLHLRRFLVPVLDALTDDTLPISWRL